MSSEPDQRIRRGAALTGALATSLIAAPPLALGTSLFADVTPPSTAVFVEYFLVLAVVILLNAIFVAGETAIDLLKPSHAKALDGLPERKASAFQELLSRKPSFVAACSLGSTTMRAWMVAMAILPAMPIVDWLRSTWPVFERWATAGNFGLGGVVLVSVLIMAIPIVALNVVFGELVPKTYAVTHPVATSLRLFGLVKFFFALFSGPIAVFVAFAGLVTQRFGVKATFAVANQTEEEIKELLEEAGESGEIEEEEKKMVRSVFEFGDTIVREVMTPRMDMESVPIGSSLIDVANIVEETGHSRIPVFEGTDDNILGIVHAKDVLNALVHGKEETTLREIVRPALFVPESKPLHDLLQELRQNKVQMAVVQDEHSGTAGLVTIEDIVEEVMGEIVDEYDPDLPQIVPMGNGFLSDGKMGLDEVNSFVGSELESEEFDTIGGYVFGLFGRQPRNGDSIEMDHLRFTVRETDGKRIQSLWIEPIPNDREPGVEILS